MAGCIFCRIVAGEIPAQVIAENQDFLVIKDIAPKAPIHNLILPKKHIPDVMHIAQEDIVLMGKMFSMAQDSARKNNIEAFRLLMNSGKEAGQSVFHLHLHFLAGQKMVDF